MAVPEAEGGEGEMHQDLHQAHPEPMEGHPGYHYDHTSESKNLPKKWLKKGTPGFVQAQVHARQSKQVVLAIFDNLGMVYTYHIHRGKTANTN
jgi:hypothetical protein